MDLFDNVDLFAIVELPAHELKKLYRGNVMALTGTCPARPALPGPS